MSEYYEWNQIAEHAIRTANEVSNNSNNNKL